jgi:hypothetical protein
MFYLIPQLSISLHLPLANTIDRFLFTFVAAGVLLGIAGFFVLFRGGAWSYLASTAVILLGYIALHFGDLYPIAPSVVVAVVPWALLATRRWYGRVSVCAFGVSVGLLAGWANFLRDQAGSGMLLFATILLASLASRRTRLTSLCALFIGAIVPVAFGHFLLDRRDAYLRQVQPRYSASVRSHVLWHTAYVGFGFLRNEIVPGYRDEVAVDKVRSEAPNVIYLSAEYDSYLKRAVLALVRQHPVFVATTIFAKLGVLAMYFLAAANLGALATIARPKPLAIEIAFGLALVFEALPGIVAVPRLTYLLGFIATAALYGVVSLEYRLRRPESIPNSDVKVRPASHETEPVCA